MASRPLQRTAAQHSVRIDVDKDEDDVKKLWKGYSWESKKVRSWEQIEEDPETGRLKSFEKSEQIARKKRRDDGLSGVRRGVIRFCVIVIDMSNPLSAVDYKPSRAELIADAVVTFAAEFFDNNPISQLAVVLTRDADAAKICSFCSSEKLIAEAVRKALRLAPLGTASLQNALNAARRLLSSVPPYGLKEAIICYGSLSTCDPGDIHATIDSLVTDKIRCSAVGMAAELHILRVLTKKTEGLYVIATDENHYRDSLSAHVVPPPTTSKQVSASLIRMGYPILRRLEMPSPYVNNPLVRGRIGYNCPRCSAWLSDVPCECTLCGLTLVSSPHLARSYHHLFPVPKFLPLDGFESSSYILPELYRNCPTLESQMSSLLKRTHLRCSGCSVLLRKDAVLRVVCPSCTNPFCVDCDVFIHESLHNCPVCGLRNSTNNLISD